VVLDPDGTDVMMLAGRDPEAELLDDAWVESIDDDDVIEVDALLLAQDDEWSASEVTDVDADLGMFDDDDDDDDDGAETDADPELGALITWLVDELCHAPRQPGGLARVLAGRRTEASRRTSPRAPRPATLGHRARDVPRV
jgi:hypothetical protein